MEQVDGVKAGESGTVTRPAWLDSAPDAYKNNEAFYPFAEPAKFYEKADALLKAEKSMVVLPGEKATEQERAAFFTRLGRPETPDKYEVGKPSDWPADVPYNEADEKAFRTMAHKHGLTTEQAKGLYGDFLSSFKGAYSSQVEAQKAAATAAENTRKEAMTKAVADLKAEWPGEAYSTNMTHATRVAEKFGLKEFLDESGIGNHIPLIKAFSVIGKAMGEDFFKAGNGGGGTPSTAGMHYTTMGDFKKQS